jgi:o-aminophenol oxidase
MNSSPSTLVAATDQPDVARPGVMSLTKFRDPMNVPPIRRPRRGKRQLTVTMREAWTNLHSELPATRLWTYDGSFPGPTIEVHEGQRLQVRWRNALTGQIPLTAVVVPGATPTPGRQGGIPDPLVAALPPWTVVHLHGSHTDGGNDGWTENAGLPGTSGLSEYGNRQRATALWYHDHAMGVTAPNVMSGILGMYWIRDDEEAALHLPHGDRELPLVLCDRNLDVDEQGRLTGRLLHKVGVFEATPELITLPFLGPYTLVNGTIWPHVDVRTGWYRFRAVNASNARSYVLEVRDEDGTPIAGVFRQIGSDGGLLRAPVTLDRVTLAPAERADLLVDFSGHVGERLTMVNVAPNAAPDPEVMQFRVGHHVTHDPFVLPAQLSASAERIDHDTLPTHEHRWLVVTLVAHSHPELWEMVETDETPTSPTDGLVQVQLPASGPTPGRLVTLRRVARRFGDATSFLVELDGWEQWSILNLSAIEHPIHLHLVQFQVLDRHTYDTSTFDATIGGSAGPATPVAEEPVPLEEQGWKDVVRVRGAELVRIAGRFSGGTGRFMYHCHILEHEDSGMMGAFVVSPAEVMALDPHGHGDDHHHA